jgi:hypothetical protein
MRGLPVLVLDGDHYEVYLTVGGFNAQVRSQRLPFVTKLDILLCTWIFAPHWFYRLVLG